MPPPLSEKEMWEGFIPHKRYAHLFCSARFDFYKCQNKKQEEKKAEEGGGPPQKKKKTLPTTIA